MVSLVIKINPNALYQKGGADLGRPWLVSIRKKFRFRGWTESPKNLTLTERFLLGR